jgi:hypothetical protein
MLAWGRFLPTAIATQTADLLVAKFERRGQLVAKTGVTGGWS